MITDNQIDKLPESALQDITLPELVRLIADSSTEHRQKAMDLVLMVGLKVCLPILENAVRNDSDANLRNGAMEALVAFGEMAVPHLTKLLTDDNEEVRNFSAVMLGDIGNPKAVAALVAALEDAEANVRHGAAEALAKIGDYRAVPPLQKMLKGDFWDHFYADAALQMLAGRVVNSTRAFQKAAN